MKVACAANPKYRCFAYHSLFLCCHHHHPLVTGTFRPVLPLAGVDGGLEPVLLPRDRLLASCDLLRSCCGPGFIVGLSYQRHKWWRQYHTGGSHFFALVPWAHIGADPPFIHWSYQSRARSRTERFFIFLLLNHILLFGAFKQLNRRFRLWWRRSPFVFWWLTQEKRGWTCTHLGDFEIKQTGLVIHGQWLL